MRDNFLFFILIIPIVLSIFYHRNQFKYLIEIPQTLLLPESFKPHEYKLSHTNFDLKISNMSLKKPCSNTDIPCSSRTSTGFDNIYLRDSLLKDGFRVSK